MRTAACLAALLAGMSGNAVAAEDPPTLAGAFLRCDGSFLDRLAPAGIEKTFARQNLRSWQLAIHRELDGLDIEKIVLEQNGDAESLRLIWTLYIKGEPEAVFPRLAPQLPPERAPMQTTMKRGKPRHIRVEFTTDGQQWSSLPLKEDGTAFNELKLKTGAARILYFGRNRRSTVHDGGSQIDSVITSVQCALLSDVETLKPQLRQLARWPETIATDPALDEAAAP